MRRAPRFGRFLIRADAPAIDSNHTNEWAVAPWQASLRQIKALAAGTP
jgi:hypothetical protein